MVIYKSLKELGILANANSSQSIGKYRLKSTPGKLTKLGLGTPATEACTVQLQMRRQVTELGWGSSLYFAERFCSALFPNGSPSLRRPGFPMISFEIVLAEALQYVNTEQY